jgi:hypothetical protein
LSDRSVRPTRCQKRRRSPPFHHSDIVFGMKPILLEMVNRLSEMGARLGALEAALVHTRQLTTGDIDRLLAAHKANLESQLATLRTAIAALPE